MKDNNAINFFIYSKIIFLTHCKWIIIIIIVNGVEIIAGK